MHCTTSETLFCRSFSCKYLHCTLTSTAMGTSVLVSTRILYCLFLDLSIGFCYFFYAVQKGNLKFEMKQSKENVKLHIIFLHPAIKMVCYFKTLHTLSSTAKTEPVIMLLVGFCGVLYRTSLTSLTFYSGPE